MGTYMQLIGFLAIGSILFLKVLAVVPSEKAIPAAFKLEASREVFGQLRASG